ncbi:MAG: NADH-quinone oxidoreductase subunit H [Candidatus Eremiobacterota bacterium]
MSLLLALLLAPVLPGVINRTKAVFAGRQGQPVLQLYYDLARLLRKGAVYSRTTSWLFTLGPSLGLAAVVLVAALVPLPGWGALASFPGDLLVVIGLLAVARFFTVLAALDTGSSFEGMGGSREVEFATVAELVFFLSLAAVVRQGQAHSLGELCARRDLSLWTHSGPAMALLLGALFILALAENSRVPVDDPNTHLELTMIHEVMVLDHSGPDLAFILYGSALKLWVMGALLVGLAVPVTHPAAGLACLALYGVAIGVVESTTARLALRRVPNYLAVAVALASLAIMTMVR